MRPKRKLPVLGAAGRRLTGMRYRLPWLVAFLLALTVTLALAGPALAGPPGLSRAKVVGRWVSCGSGGWLCGRVRVPLDYQRPSRGSVILSVNWRRRKRGRPIIFGLAGGPGQAARPFADQLGNNVATALRSRDLVVFDQRGTGESNLLRCPTIETDFYLLPDKILGCAQRLGKRRAFFRSQDSVWDLEALRRLMKAPKVSIYGVSYGTRVALQYGRSFPRQTDRLLLDSVVDSQDDDVFFRPSYHSMSRVLDQVCAANRCSGITPSASADLATVGAALAKQPQSWVTVDAAGQPLTWTITTTELFYTILAGDFDTPLRAMTPGALHSAANGDFMPLVRLWSLAQQSYAVGGNPEEFSTALYAATRCGDGDFPWARSLGTAARQQALRDTVFSLPAAEFAPFSPQTSIDASDALTCTAWPEAGDLPTPKPLPKSLKVLMLSGAFDTTTPHEVATGLLGQLPRAKQIIAPDTSHDVIDSGSSCAARAVSQFFRGKKISSCSTTLSFDTTVRAGDPARLADVASVSGLSDPAGQALRGTQLSVVDLFGYLDYQFSSFGRANKTIGGLRGGNVSFARENGILVASFSDYSYISGLLLNGKVNLNSSLEPTSGSLTISGTSNGTLTVTKGWALEGTIDGQAASLTAATVRRRTVWPRAQSRRLVVLPLR